MTIFEICGIISYILTAFGIFVAIYKEETKDRKVRFSVALSMLAFSFCWPGLFVVVFFSDAVPWAFKKLMSKTELLRWRLKYRFDPFEGVSDEVFAILKLEKETEKHDKKLAEKC